MSAKLTIRLLGGFTLELDGKPVSGLPSRKAEALIAYLVMHKRPFPRELLADLLWDDRPQDQTLANLRSLLSGVRRKLGPFLTVTRQSIGFNHDADYWLDVAAFTAQLPARDPTSVSLPNDLSQIETAVAIYQGHFLDGFYVRESRRFEEWASIERERLQRLAVSGLQQLVHDTLNRGQYAAGIEYAVRLLEFDPLSEAAHRHLMLLLARSGQRNSALKQYDICCQILENELGVPPANETTALYQRIRSSQTAPLHNLPPQTTPFVGRETEMVELSRLLADENGRFITLLGPGGIGKTRLALQAAMHIVQNQPGMFLHGIRFVPLHTIDSGEFLHASIAAALDFSFSRPQPPDEQLINYLRGKEVLLILDNFEQLLHAPNSGLTLLTNILQQAPFVKLLVTSRIRLHVPGEQLFDMRGLSFPTKNTAVLAENYSAVRLFIESARRVHQDFAPDQAEMAAIVRICRLLDGIPLGIELAAAWVRLLSCAEVEAGIAQDL
ncbi:MAG: NACHT domain-containing protein, partial [Anaerolineales bacterium]|nr:NACHT domain-containing protein [Anaerolineales bacterium]